MSDKFNAYVTVLGHTGTKCCLAMQGMVAFGTLTLLGSREARNFLELVLEGTQLLCDLT